MKYPAQILCAALAILLSWPGTVDAQAKPEFRLGFKVLADQIPEVAGQPLENEHWGTNGDSLQQTTTGLMAWRKADNWTAFTNGSRSWINGPAGVQDRANDERFSWEAGSPSAPPAPPAQSPTPKPAGPTPTPTPAPARSYTPEVKATDDASAAHGASIVKFMAALDEEWARAWGWRPSRPTTIYLYSGGHLMVAGLEAASGSALSADVRQRYITSAVAVATRDVRTNGWAVVVDLAKDVARPEWEANLKTVLAHEYAHVMQFDAAGTSRPTWFAEGMAELCAYSSVPGSPYLKNRMEWISEGKREGNLPTISQLHADWNGASGQSPARGPQSYGVAYIAAQLLADKVGGAPLLQVLKRSARGEDFNTVLQAATGYNVQSLDKAVQAKIGQ